MTATPERIEEALAFADEVATTRSATGHPVDKLLVLAAALREEREKRVAAEMRLAGQEIGDAAALREAREQRDRASFLAENLFLMVPEQVWRDGGGDDGQGHYEGDYHAAQTQEEIRRLRALAVSPPADEAKP